MIIDEVSSSNTSSDTSSRSTMTESVHGGGNSLLLLNSEQLTRSTVNVLTYFEPRHLHWKSLHFYRIQVLSHIIYASKINSWVNTYDVILWWFSPSLFNWPTLSQVLIWSDFSYKNSIRGPIDIFIMARIIKSSVFSTYLSSSTPFVHRFETVNVT